MKRVGILAALSLVLLLAFKGCFGGWTTSWNQRLTLVIETPQGEVRGSSVTLVSFSPRNKFILRYLDSSTLKLNGEAAMAEVLPGRWLFALLPDQERLIYHYAKDHLTDAPLALEEAVPAIVDQRAPVTLDPTPDPHPHAGRKFPILVTFDDTSRPDTVRLVDPVDLDAALGCPRTDGILFPWRSVGLTWHNWIERETTRLSRERAGHRAGLDDTVSAALVETHLIIDDHSYDRKDEVRLEELRKLFTEEQMRRWQEARLELVREIPASLPSPETLSAPVGGQCHVLNAVTIQVVDEPVTQGMVQGVLLWLEEVGRERSTLIPNPPRSSTDLTNPDIQLLDSSAFSTEIFK